MNILKHQTKLHLVIFWGICVLAMVILQSVSLLAQDSVSNNQNKPNIKFLVFPG
jgi:hypothetical protein